MTSKPSELCLNTEQVPEKWTKETSPCRASTSRGLSHSSGDFDGSESISFCSNKCSCDSHTMYFQEYSEVPCVIRSSSTQLRRNKWNIFKKYLNFIKKRKYKKYLKSKNKESRNEKLEDSDKEIEDTEIL